MVRMLFTMKIFFSVLFLSVVWLLPTKTDVQEPVLAESIFANTLERILASSCLRKKNFGVKIHSLERDETLYSVHSERLFSPASNIKLLTTAMALKRMGPDYRFKTQLCIIWFLL